MNNYSVYKKNLYEMIELWSSSEKQIEFQQNVPIAHVSHELFNDWESSFADGFEFEKFLSEKEINLFNQFNETINKISDATPQILPEIAEFIKTDEWKVINQKAIEILKQLKS